MEPWTSVEHVLGQWIGDDAPQDEALVKTWIRRAERLIRFEVPGITDRIAATTVAGVPLEPDLLEAVRDVVSSMIYRKFTNPRGSRTVTTTTGPFTDQETLGGENPGALELTPKELALLRGAERRQTAFSINLGGMPAYQHPLQGALVNGPAGWAPGETP